jgi:fatty-acid peroxygenase
MAVLTKASSEIPHVGTIDSTLALVLEGYPFISTRCKKLATDAFSCRLMLRSAVCISGPTAAELFYDTTSFRRRDVAPARIRKTLLGEGGLHGLDGPAHRHRKAMFLSFMGPHCLAPFRARAEAVWQDAARKWRGREIAVFEEARRLLFRAVAEFAGIPIAKDEVEHRSADLMAMVDAFGGLGPRHWRGTLARARSERWIANIIGGVRRGTLQPKRGSALEVICAHRDLQGALLDRHTAAVEFLNVIRPMMAVAYFVELAAAALSVQTHLRSKIIGDDAALERFVHELRRYCPFTPFLGAEACRHVQWNGYRIPEGTLTVLDVYGIQHDERICRTTERKNAPPEEGPGCRRNRRRGAQGADAFDPSRFKSWDGNRFTLLQQGGGVHADGHRCAGEWLTVEALKIASRTLASIDYETDCRRLVFDLARIPSRLIGAPLVLRVERANNGWNGIQA